MFPTWMTIKNWFWHSETIAWAFVQLAAGIIWTTLSQTDLAPLLDPKWLTWWLIFSGIVTGYLRMRGTQTVATLSSNGETAKFLAPADPLLPSPSSQPSVQ